MRASDSLTGSESGGLADRIAAEIRAEMARQQIRGVQLAERMGENEAWVSRKIRGLSPMTVNEVDRFAQALGLTFRQLVLAAEERRVNYASSPAIPRTIPAPAPRHPVAVGQTAAAVAVRTRTNGPRTSRPLWRHG